MYFGCEDHLLRGYIGRMHRQDLVDPRRAGQDRMGGMKPVRRDRLADQQIGKRAGKTDGRRRQQDPDQERGDRVAPGRAPSW